ncbi:actinodin1 [Brachyhypopomus gauderio]|uniref:actinodin1 n=1 Tax=Brachyhypopomus gauderio TaxID=698409 RepID=UPI004041E7BA
MEMARLKRSSFCHMFIGVSLAAVVLSEMLLAVPVIKREDGQNAASPRKLSRSRRNISWYKQHSDFWNWYKFFSDSGNEQGVADMDRVYLAYLQKKNRAESQRSYKVYLQHLSDIYKSCAESDDPNCVASYTSRSKPRAEPQQPAPFRSCDPFRDPYCLHAQGYSQYPYTPAGMKAAASAPAPLKTPSYIRTPAPREPLSGYYYSPMVQSFLSNEQKSELLRICNAEDVECLQYHLRAAYGYKPAPGPAPSYAHLGCDPKSDPNCVAQLMQKAPSGLYHRYPSCDPRVDPYCAYAQSLESALAPARRDTLCNPLFDENCNPLMASRFASLVPPSDEPKDEPATAAGAMRLSPSPHFDPMAMYQDSAASPAMRRRAPTQHQQLQLFQPPSQEENRHPLGPPGKTKEGYDCFIGYDEECFPVRAHNEPQPSRRTTHFPEAYEPHLNADGTRKGVIEPDPDCDPEYDSNCRLRRYEPEADDSGAPEPREHQPGHDQRRDAGRQGNSPHHREDTYPEQQGENPGYDQQQYDAYMSGQEDTYANNGSQEPGAVSFQDLLRGYGGRYQDDHRAYTGDYNKK